MNTTTMHANTIARAARDYATARRTLSELSITDPEWHDAKLDRDAALWRWENARARDEDNEPSTRERARDRMETPR